ncbi:cilia- and flagella-associated protein 251 [Cajanus cajan]|uniref:Uncharacterized protein n=1 Tax=Cajanus cajan TaxID=3821 RepID=A0A151TP79_CAJCA|nr:cilia- and flagella-associated protein 251 [Cajanus cajan]XP_029127211.1 cilia- and flagella-associated protein 251 [Cajanus cajan]KYP68827.1 hypothetical protein KK1_022473 [Cajanus cajan]
MAYNKGLHLHSSGGSHRGRPYALILLITFGVALLGVMVLHKLRERRIYALIVKEKDHQILALQLLLQKERDRSKELRGKNEEMKGKIYALRSKKMELGRTVVEMQSTLNSLKDEQKLMESAFEEQQNELRLMQEKERNVREGGSEIVALRENLEHKEEEIKDLKRSFEIPVNDNQTIFPESQRANETMTAQDESDKDDSFKYEGEDDEDASKSELTDFKDGDVGTEIKDEIRTNREVGKTNEDPQDEGGVRAKDIDDAEVVDEREKKTIREENAAQVENSTEGEGQDVKVKQSTGMKKKHGRASRKKGNRRGIVKNSLMENNGVFDNLMNNRKVNKDELKGRRVGKVSDEESFARKDEERDNDNPRKGKPQAKLLKPENKDVNDMKVNDTNQWVTNSGTNIYPEKQKLDEMRQSEENEKSIIQQNWSKKHINKANKNAGLTKSKVLPEELKELEDVQTQEKDATDNGHDDDFLKESESEDEKGEYREEKDESSMLE